ncbi:MAG: SPOR domain-containing protein [Gammaproteobacteria bacterium]|nr:SPOR domain-containing protein [Gammaproteobacteria bacterium]
MMERALKERIIGAAVLVVFVVLVVPIFLDGPPESGEVVSERVLLPGQEGQDIKTVVLDRERSEPVPSASNTEVVDDAKVTVVEEPEISLPVPAPIEKEPAPAQTDQQSVRESAPATAGQPASSTGMWAVQLGSFSNKENAERLAADLRKQGYAAFLSQLNTGDGALHRVRIGPQKDRASAEAMAARLLKVGHKGQVVPHP